MKLFNTNTMKLLFFTLLLLIIGNRQILAYERVLPPSIDTSAPVEMPVKLKGKAKKTAKKEAKILARQENGEYKLGRDFLVTTLFISILVIVGVGLHGTGVFFAFFALIFGTLGSIYALKRKKVNSFSFNAYSSSAAGLIAAMCIIAGIVGFGTLGTGLLLVYGSLALAFIAIATLLLLKK